MRKERAFVKIGFIKQSNKQCREYIMSINSQFGFYAVLTDPLIGYGEMTRILVDYKIAFVQLRMKDAPQDMIRRTAEKMRALTLGSSTKFIVNDSPEIANEVDADGVHIGQGDYPIEDVRAMVRPGMIIGLSTHSVTQTTDACLRNPDYIGVGPVSATPTKKNPDPVIGVDGMKKQLDAATVPAVAIGGIEFSNLRDVLSAGAKNFCMVRQLTKSNNPSQVLDEMKKIYNEYYPGFY
jgi:thiamine-phosphate pyrophosphorylase